MTSFAAYFEMKITAILQLTNCVFGYTDAEDSRKPHQQSMQRLIRSWQNLGVPSTWFMNWERSRRLMSSALLALHYPIGNEFRCSTGSPKCYLPNPNVQVLYHFILRKNA